MSSILFNRAIVISNSSCLFRKEDQVGRTVMNYVKEISDVMEIWTHFRSPPTLIHITQANRLVLCIVGRIKTNNNMVG